ncbi:MAG: methyltransferase domain-containing protein [Phycisphaerae bacterium]|nr:methyltransferase domain-containing protein [Phycisphaerae bacterium]
MTVWHDNDTFWVDTASFMFSPSRWEQTPAEVDHMLELLKLSPGDAVLDLPCGPGRHSLELARRGFKVTGVDRTSQYLVWARQKADAEALGVEWVEADMRSFRRPGAYSAIVNLLTSFGYFEDQADDCRVAEHFFAGLQPGGQLLMEMMGKECLARIFRERDWHQADDGTLWLEERKLSPDWGWVDVHWISIRDSQRREHRFGHRLYAATELVALLREVGFDPVTVFGSLEGEPYDHNAKRLVLLARKPEGEM